MISNLVTFMEEMNKYYIVWREISFRVMGSKTGDICEQPVLADFHL